MGLRINWFTIITNKEECERKTQLNPASVPLLLRLLQSLVMNNVNVKCYAEDTLLYTINPQKVSKREKHSTPASFSGTPDQI